MKRIKGIYVPYVKYSLIFLALHGLFYHFNLYNEYYGYTGAVSQPFSSIDYLKNGVSIITRMSGHDELLGGFWFLRSLLVGSILGYFIIRYINRTPIAVFMLLAASVIGFWFHLSVPYFEIGAQDIFAAFFFVSGYQFNKLKVSSSSLIKYNWLLVISAVVLITFGTTYWQGTVKQNEWYKVIPYAITAIAGTFACYSISLLININANKLKDLLVYVGNNTMTILTWHMLSFRLISLVIITIYGLDIRRLAEHPAIEEYAQQGWWIAYFLIGCILPLTIKSISNKIWVVVKK